MPNFIEETIQLRVCICGGRDYSDIDYFEWFMNEVFVPRVNLENIIIIQGGAKGADYMAKRWAINSGVTHEEFPADWDTHGRLAGMIRNKVMLKSGIHYLISFPGGAGTANMRKICKAAGVSVITAERFRPGDAPK